VKAQDLYNRIEAIAPEPLQAWMRPRRPVLMAVVADVLAAHVPPPSHGYNPDAPFNVAALYVDAKGPYPKLVREWYDATRDARSYQGNLPVVAHPPCGPWGKYAARCKFQDRDTGRHAIEQVRRVGGVVEHPVGSGLFKEMEIPTAPWTPDRPLDAYGGYTIRISQLDLGHRAQKETILYIVGTYDLPPALAAAQVGAEPHPVERMGKKERRLTPEALAWNLASLAAHARPPQQLRDMTPATQATLPTARSIAEYVWGIDWRHEPARSMQFKVGHGKDLQLSDVLRAQEQADADYRKGQAESQARRKADLAQLARAMRGVAPTTASVRAALPPGYVLPAAAPTRTYGYGGANQMAEITLPGGGRGIGEWSKGRAAALRSLLSKIEQKARTHKRNPAKSTVAIFDRLRASAPVQLWQGRASWFPEPRDWAMVVTPDDKLSDGKHWRVYVHPRFDRLPVECREGLLRHELAHVLLHEEGRPEHSEQDADDFAARRWGDRINYDDNDVQTIGPGAHPRPAHLPEE